jgi:methyltransferase (TIGR00027 family)
MTDTGEISHVSDTALWVAALRGREQQRPDAAFQDPLADMLAGIRGRRIAASMPRSALVAWAVVVRTTAIDQLIHEGLTMGIDSVLNLGAGMDTRPYRLNLPARLRWIEVDFPAVVEFKDAALLGYRPTCAVERVGLNLLDRNSRSELLARFGSQNRNTLVIAEGVIPYFSNDDAAALAVDLASIAAFRHWIMDFENAGKRTMPRAWAKRLKSAPFQFQVADWFEFFEQLGWQPHQVITSAQQSATINRPYPRGFPLGFLMYALPAAIRQRILSLSGAVLLRRQPLGRKATAADPA